MRINVIKAFPYSPHGYDNAQADVGVQDLPDDIAAIALHEGWARKLEPIKGKGGVPFATEEARDVAEKVKLVPGDFTGRDPGPGGFTLDQVGEVIGHRERQQLLGLTAKFAGAKLAEALQGCSPADLAVVREGEVARENRKGVLELLDTRAAELQKAAAQ